MFNMLLSGPRLPGPGLRDQGTGDCPAHGGAGNQPSVARPLTESMRAAFAGHLFRPDGAGAEHGALPAIRDAPRFRDWRGVTTAFQACTLASTRAARLLGWRPGASARAPHACAFPAGAENRKAARIPLHSARTISRAGDWKAAADHPIDRGAWKALRPRPPGPVPL